MRKSNRFGGISAFCAFAAMFVSLSVADGAEYWVATNGVDTNPGTQASPWLTVGKAASVAKTNDFIHVTAGTYDEKVTPAFSGSAGTNITYKGEGYPIIRGFNFTGKSNWAVIGFHFYHPSTNYAYDAIFINQCAHFRILDNYFDSINATHAVISSGQAVGYLNYCSYGLIRSNLFYRAGLVSGGKLVPTPDCFVGGTNNLIEYNDMSESDDFTRIYGQYNIVRNNYFHDTPYSLFSNQPHTDGMQCYDATNEQPGFDHNLMECNMMISNCNNNGHFYILRNSQPPGVFTMTDFTVRKNVALYTGDQIGFDSDAPNIREYNNSWAFVNGAVIPTHILYYATTVNMQGGTIPPTNFVEMNNVFLQASDQASGYILSGLTNGPPWFPIVTHNLSFRSGPRIQGDRGGSLINIDPVCTDTNAFDLHLLANSPAIGASAPQTTATSGGVQANIVPVQDAGFFMDGWGIPDVAGDVVMVGANPGVMITQVDYGANTLTLASNITWNSGDGVTLAGTQDIGAYPYDPLGYNYGINLVAPPPGVSIAGAPATLSAAVTNPGKVRIIRFYVNGIEVGNAPPAQIVSISATINASNSVVQARAYPLYATTQLAATSTVTVNQGILAPPSNLHVVQ